MPLIQQISERYTYRDYLTWPDDERWEIMDGIAYNMSPAPAVTHQRISRNFEVFLVNELQLKKKECEVFDAPTDVVFDEYNVVQPDVFVVCDKTKITEDNIQGAPDLIVEVISPSTSLKDRREKKKLYEKFGVKEYLIIYPEDELVERFILQNDKYPAPDVFNWDEAMKLESLELDVNLWDIFGKEREEKEEIKEQQDR
jgi:Uma2 family endonuclease